MAHAQQSYRKNDRKPASAYYEVRHPQLFPVMKS